MTETIPVRVQHKRMSASDWASSPLVLLDGELGIESDTGKVKVGNGRDRFSALQYLTGPKGDRGETGPVGPKGADGVVRFEGSAAERALEQYAKKSETPVYRIAKGDISGTGEGGTEIIDKNFIFNSDGIKVGDIVQDIFVTDTGTQEGFWKVTNVNGNRITLNGIGMRNVTSYGKIIGRITALENRPTFDTLTESQRNSLRGPAGPAGARGANGATGPAGPRGADGAPGQNIINQNDGQALKYWAGTRSQYDAISNKDANTIYDIYR